MPIFLENFTLNPKVKVFAIIFLISWFIFSILIENRKTEIIDGTQKDVLKLNDEVNKLNDEVNTLRSQITYLQKENVIIRTSLTDCNLSYTTVTKPN